MVGIEFFAGTQKITKAFNTRLGGCKSLDFVQLKNERKIDFLIDFLDIFKSIRRFALGKR